MDELVEKINSQQILSILEQVQKVNYMIDLHRLHQEESMVKQFERQRDTFLEELMSMFASLRIRAELTALAA